MNAIIATRELSRRFGKHVAVKNLSMEVPRGSICALLGPNGAGKTTTIKMLMNMVRPSGGRAQLFSGMDSARLGPGEYARIGYVSENQELPEWMKVQDLIDYCQPMYPTWDKDLCGQLIRPIRSAAFSEDQEPIAGCQGQNRPARLLGVTQARTS